MESMLSAQGRLAAPMCGCNNRNVAAAAVQVECGVIMLYGHSVQAVRPAHVTA